MFLQKELRFQKKSGILKTVQGHNALQEGLQ